MANETRLADHLLTNGVRLLVCGGRDFNDTENAYKVLDAMHRALGIDVIIEGDARGADRIAGYWARRNRVTNLKFPADWNAHGPAAGSCTLTYTSPAELTATSPCWLPSCARPSGSFSQFAATV